MTFLLIFELPNGRVQPLCGAQRSKVGCNPLLGVILALFRYRLPQKLGWIANHNRIVANTVTSRIDWWWKSAINGDVLA